MDVVAGINRNRYFTGLYLSRRALASVFDIERPKEGETNAVWFEGPSVYVETVALAGLRQGLANCANIAATDIPDVADYTLARAYFKSGAWA